MSLLKNFFIWIGAGLAEFFSPFKKLSNREVVAKLAEARRNFQLASSPLGGAGKHQNSQKLQSLVLRLKKECNRRGLPTDPASPAKHRK